MLNDDTLRSPLLQGRAPSRFLRWSIAFIYMSALALITIFCSLMVYVLILMNPIAEPMSSRNTFWGISYNPAREGDWCPDIDKVLEDLTLIAPITKRIRTYGNACHLDKILTVIHNNTKILGDIRVMAGISIADDNDENQGAIHEILSVIKKHGASHIDMINVGNEVIMHHYITVNELIRLIHQVRRQVGGMFFRRIAITTVDIDTSFYGSPKLIKAVDAIVANIHPYFASDVPASSAVEITWGQLNRLQDVSQGKEVMIGETGWPSRGDEPRTTPKTYQAYMEKFVCRAMKSHVKFYWFEAFDADWKKNVDPIEHNWGIFGSDRLNKTGITVPPFSCDNDEDNKNN